MRPLLTIGVVVLLPLAAVLTFGASTPPSKSSSEPEKQRAPDRISRCTIEISDGLGGYTSDGGCTIAKDHLDQRTGRAPFTPKGSVVLLEWQPSMSLNAGKHLQLKPYTGNREYGPASTGLSPVRLVLDKDAEYVKVDVPRGVVVVNQPVTLKLWFPEG